MRHQPTTLSAHAGLTTCLRCERHFESWDRRQNRLCPSCRQYLHEAPSNEPSYVLPKRRHLTRED
jgi:hypothetical protein